MPIDSRIPLSGTQARPFDAFDKGNRSREQSRLSDLQATGAETTNRLNELKLGEAEANVGKPKPWDATQLKVAREMASRLLTTYEGYKDQPDAQQQWEQDAAGASQMLNGMGIDTSALPDLTPANVANFATQVDQSFSGKPLEALGPDKKPGLFQFNKQGESKRLEGLAPIPKAGEKRRIVKGADGFNYYEDTQERVLPKTKKSGGKDGAALKTTKGKWPVSKLISIWKSETNQSGTIDPAAMIRAVRGEAPEENSKASSFLDWWNGSDLNPEGGKPNQPSAAELAAEEQGLVLLP